MIELEVYAAGVRDLNKILELDHTSRRPRLALKVDSNHNIVAWSSDEPTITFREICSRFIKLGLEPRFVGAPPELRPKPRFLNPERPSARAQHETYADPIFLRHRRHCPRVFVYLGELVVLAAETMWSAATHRLRWRLFLRQMVDIGLLSQLVVVITGGFTGAVFAAQTYFQFNKLGVASGVGSVVSAALFRELGPVLTGLMVTRPGGGGDVGGDRNDESDRTNRRPARPRGASSRLSGRAADACDDGFDAVARGGMHRLRSGHCPISCRSICSTSVDPITSPTWSVGR